MAGGVGEFGFEALNEMPQANFISNYLYLHMSYRREE